MDVRPDSDTGTLWRTVQDGVELQLLDIRSRPVACGVRSATERVEGPDGPGETLGRNEQGTGARMATTERRRFQCQHVADLARELLGQLFAVHAGEAARAVRVYRESDAVMLLLRFDPALAGCGGDAELESRIEASLMAMCEMVTEVVSQRSGSEIVPGNLSVCAATGLAVFAMRVAGEEQRSPCYRVSGARGHGRREGERKRLSSGTF
jgi:hypothetical protein